MVKLAQDYINIRGYSKDLAQALLYAFNLPSKDEERQYKIIESRLREYSVHKTGFTNICLSFDIVHDRVKERLLQLNFNSYLNHVELKTEIMHLISLGVIPLRMYNPHTLKEKFDIEVSDEVREYITIDLNLLKALNRQERKRKERQTLMRGALAMQEDVIAILSEPNSIEEKKEVKPKSSIDKNSLIQVLANMNKLNFKHITAISDKEVSEKERSLILELMEKTKDLEDVILKVLKED